jgi:hypothetical protein
MLQHGRSTMLCYYALAGVLPIALWRCDLVTMHTILYA